MSSGGIKVEPGSVGPGGSVKVTGPPNGTVHVLVPGSKERPQDVKLDEHGQANIKVPANAGDHFFVVDNAYPHTQVRVTVTRPKSSGPD